MKKRFYVKPSASIIALDTEADLLIGSKRLKYDGKISGLDNSLNDNITTIERGGDANGEIEIDAPVHWGDLWEYDK